MLCKKASEKDPFYWHCSLSGDLFVVTSPAWSTVTVSFDRLASAGGPKEENLVRRLEKRAQ